MEKVNCVGGITLEDITLDYLEKIFVEMDERVRRAHSVEEVVPILRETYFHLRTHVLEDYITKEMENKPDTNKLDEAPMKPTTPIPLPIEVPQEFRASCVDGEILPGEIIYLNLDGYWRPYRVMANVNGEISLLGLFSIGEINKKALRYSENSSSLYCDAWYGDILRRDQNIENHLKLSKIGAARFYVHIPDWKELQADCKAIAGDLSPSWYNNDDLSNILVYTGRTGMMSILCGEDRELHEFPYGEVVNDYMDCFPAEVHPAFTLCLDSLPYYYDPVCRADLAEFS